MAMEKEDVNLSMAGCGFLGIYHVGISACLQNHAPDFKHRRMAGASAGAMAAVGFLCDVPPEAFVADILKICAVATSKTLGLLHPTVNVTDHLRASMETRLPEDAHHRVNGKIHISMTRVWDRKNFIYSHFESREELIQAIMCSGFIPVFSGWLAPLFRGERYMDGGWTDNLPVLDASTVTVSPFTGESDICPRDSVKASGTSGLFNINVANTSIDVSKANIIRIASALFPSSADILVQTCQQGYRDATRFLVHNDFIKCERCCAAKESDLPSDGDDEGFQEDDVQSQGESAAAETCADCQARKESLLMNTSLPPNILSVIQENKQKSKCEDEEITVVKSLVKSASSALSYVTKEAAVNVGALLWKFSYTL